MDPIIHFERVSKQYRLGSGNTNLREAITGSVKQFTQRNSSEKKSEKSFWALDDVSFNLNRGDALGLIGPNGAGKTTILKILANITRPTSGKVDVKGRISALIELGAGFHPDLSGRENIYLNGTILGLSRKEITKALDRIVDFSGLEKFIDTPVKRYSSGMYVRLGFSVAAHIEPDVLLVDEVLAVGDAQFRQKCARRIEELRKLGTTIVFVAHNLYLVKSVCDSAIYMNHGRIQAHGDTVEAISAYENWMFKNQITETISYMDEQDISESSSVNLTAVEVRSLNGSAGNKFKYGDDVEIRVCYETKQPVYQPNLVLRVSRSDGTTCFMIRTDDYGHYLEDLDGKGVISVMVDPIQLSSGAYTIEAKLLMRSLDGVPLASKHSSWFEVEGLSLGYEEASGVFIPNVKGARVETSHDGIRIPDDL